MLNFLILINVLILRNSTLRYLGVRKACYKQLTLKWFRKKNDEYTKRLQRGRGKEGKRMKKANLVKC